MRTDVAITGVGAVTPLGIGATALIERWSAGASGIEDGLGRCQDFDPRAFLSSKEARRTDRFTQLAVGACEEAVRQAGWTGGLPYEPERIGCVLATGIGGLATLERQYEIFREHGQKRISPLAVPLMMGNAAAAVLAMRYGLRGYSSTTVTVPDAPSTDHPADLEYPNHRTHGERCVIHTEMVHNMTRLPRDRDFWVMFFPLRLEGGTGSPARAIAIWEP